MDGQRQQYFQTIPPPPPRPTQLQAVNITGFPPPPPPPGPPPVQQGYAQPWQQPAYGRQVLTSGYTLSPPAAYAQHAPYKPASFTGVDPAYTSATYVPGEPPLTSATYVPGNDTLGGGFPPLYEHSHGRTNYDPYAQQRQTGAPVYMDGAYNPQTPAVRPVQQPQQPFAIHNNYHELSNEHVNPQPQMPSQAAELTKSPSHRHNTSGASLGGLSPSEAAAQWPLDKVLLWLAKNHFSKDWQDTFRALELQGAEFLELGLAWGGRGNIGKIHQVVYPQLAKECVRNGTGWDSERERIERNEGLRIRRLIRHLHDGTSDSSISTPLRPDPPPFFDSSNPYPREPRSAIEGTNDLTAEQLAATQTSSTGQKQNTGTRSFTTPNPTGHGSPYESPLRENASGRSEFSRNALSSALNDHRRQSPSISNDTGTFAGSTLRPENSPKSGSPATQFASPYNGNGQASSSTGDLPLRQDHSRGNSTDSIPGVGRGPSSAIGGRYYENRKQGEGARPSPQGEHPHGYGKEHGKGFFDRFDRLRKKTRGTDSSHPSPRESDLEPPSPGEHHYVPYSMPGFSTSDLSVNERPLSSTPTKTKRWVMVTVDGENYRLLDITDMESSSGLRTGICKRLSITDWGSAQIFLTEPGQSDHHEPMNDESLLRFRRGKSDSTGAIKLLYVKGSQKARLSAVEGLGVSINTTPHEKPALSPTAAHTPITRKPLAEDARVSPQTQLTPSSPFSSSRQPTLKASGAPGETSADPLKDDLFARHEAYKREVERRQEENHISRHPPSPQLPRDGAYGENGFRSTKVIDFDKRRVSPFEEKKTSPYDDKKAETLVPFRKPPVAPNESTTLTKVNSLRKPQYPQTHGLGAALTSIGRITSAIGTPATSVNTSASTPSSANRDSTGFDSDRPPTFDSADTASSRTTWESSQSGTRRSGQGNEKSPASFADPSRRSSLQSRKSFGPEFVFEENEVSFQRTPQPTDGSDDDDSSDDGLFMVPLANKNENTADPVEETKSSRENLRVDTNQRGPRVTFESPVNPGESSGGEFSDKQDPGTFYHDGSPVEEKTNKRFSIVNDDVWASRPAVEGVIDNLDSFFPGVDLDAPYLDEPASPNTKGHHDDSTLKGRPEHPPPIPSSSVDPTTLYGTDTSTMRPQAGSKMVANRLMNQSGAGAGGGGGGLGRTKSIRQVARDSHRTKSVSSSGPQKSGMLRRKSTKMFGAKIMQISPQPGNRLSRLDPIPQNVSHPEPSGSVPQRQPTFRIIRGQLIGKGTYGRVYLGMNADNGEVLAVKQVDVNPRIAGSDRDRIKEMVNALDQEIDTMQHLEHPNIVQYLGCERGEMSISIYLEYISGGSIGSCLRKHGKFEESVVKSLTRQTLSGLAYLHDMGILHRDLKADNILLDLDGTCKISDFGISKKTDDIYGNDSSNSMQGSVFWMAPEVIQSQGQGYSAKVDIWSLGCVVLEMFAGRRPWSKEEAIGAIFKLGSLGQAPPIPEDVSANATVAALSFMWDCFTVDSADRPTAGTLLTRHPFCESDPNYNFLDTELYKKIGLPAS
ncbi:hypothetical protein N7540_003857 [Penicillium herquei]|nr:hypothetical protein N7540_003857 [Penicillium herquei]